jgi:site-specific recombinase XerD
VTHLRKIMLEELQRRNYAQHTTRSYIRTVEDFARHFHCSPDRLGPRHIREYQAELFEKRKLSAGSVAVRLAAIRFFYCKTLKRIRASKISVSIRRLPMSSTRSMKYLGLGVLLRVLSSGGLDREERDEQTRD